MHAANIVFATDFSMSSDGALQVATSLARDTGAMLHIVHVKEPFVAYKLDSKYGKLPPYPELEMLQEALEKVVPADPDVPYRHWLFTSENIPKQILKLAEELQADFVVMGTHGRVGWSRLLTGSVAESVIRQADCPVLTVKHPRLAIIEAIPGYLPS